jgi:hypothetical protein
MGTVCDKQLFACMRNRMWEKLMEGEWSTRGNRLDLDKGEKMELESKTLVALRKISEMMRERGGEGQSQEEINGRESEENGISVEGEYTFISTVGRFSKQARKEGYF